MDKQQEFTDKDYEDCIETFKFLDSNQNGVIELSEMCNGISSLGLNLTKTEIEALLNHFGKETHESLTFEEYRQFYYECVLAHDLTREEAIQLFHESDLNKDGLLDVFDLKCMILNHGSVLDEDEIHALLRDYDFNHDSMLNLEEFIKSVYS